VEPNQLLAGLQAELGGEAAPGAGKRVERLRLAAGPVERQHQLPPQPLLERMRRHEGLELGHELTGRAGRKIGFDSQ
jgi:hypothetical protein